MCQHNLEIFLATADYTAAMKGFAAVKRQTLIGPFQNDEMRNDLSQETLDFIGIV